MPKNLYHIDAKGHFVYSTTDRSGKRHGLRSRKNEGKRAFLARCDKLDRECEGQIYSGIDSFGDLFSAWLEQYALIYCSKADRDVMKWAYETYLQDRLGLRPVTDIKVPEVYSILSGLIHQGLSRSTITKVRAAISRPYGWAINTQKMNLVNPVQGLRLRIPKLKSEVNAPMSSADSDRVLAAARGTKYEHYFSLLLATGLRPSEALGLRREDIVGDRLLIRRAMTVRGISTLKNASSSRDLPITQNMKDILSAQLRRVPPLCPWLFPSASGSPNMEAIVTAFRGVLKRTEMKKGTLALLPVEATLYSFRHTFATRMAEAGMQIKTLQYLMGHSDPQTTLAYYVSITDSMLGEAQKIMQATMEKSLNGIEMV